MEHHIGEICKERGIDLTPEVENLLSDQEREALYLVNDSIFLHVQETDGGWDYSLYDKETLRLIDGGVLEHEIVAESPIARPIAAARTEIMVLEGIQPEKVIFQDLSCLEELHAAQDRFAAQAIQDYIGEVLQRHIEVPPDPTISIEHMHACGFKDPDMLPISEDRAKELADRGAQQIFSFGPALVIDGEVGVIEGEEVERAQITNPRTAIGILEPLHYLMVVSDGRTTESRGLSLFRLAELMRDEGCETAYNLDGGGSSTIWFNGKVLNKPTTYGDVIAERTMSDIVYIGY
jgi:hypothetical protein